MLVKTFVKSNPEIKELWLQSKESFARFDADDFDFLNRFGHYKVKKIEPPPVEGELTTLHI